METLIHTMVEALRQGARIGLILAALFAPLAAAQSVDAGYGHRIGELPEMATGAGLVLLIGLQRS